MEDHLRIETRTLKFSVSSMAGWAFREFLIARCFYGIRWGVLTTFGGAEEG